MIHCLRSRAMFMGENRHGNPFISWLVLRQTCGSSETVHPLLYAFPAAYAMHVKLNARTPSDL